jgi:hypothetical protein
MFKQKNVKNRTYYSEFVQGKSLPIKQKGVNCGEFYEKNSSTKVKVSNLKLFRSISESSFSVYYVRYDDELMVGLNFEKKLAKVIIYNIQVFIKSDLHLDSNDSSFSCCNSKWSCFLGFNVGISSVKLSRKSSHTHHFNRIKINLQRKKTAESQKYFKLVEHISSKTHRELLDSVHGPKFVDNARFKDIRQTTDLKDAVKGDCHNMLIYRSMHKNQIKCYMSFDCYKYRELL